MYYRKGSYPKSGHADVPGDVWAEFQRIREHLSGVDQNNVAPNTIGRDLVVAPFDPDHNGISDIIGVDNSFLYKEKLAAAGVPIREFTSSNQGSWYDLGRKGLRLKAVSRGDAPWIVGASVSAVVANPLRIEPTTRGDYIDLSVDPPDPTIAGQQKKAAKTYSAADWAEALDQEQRGSLHLRIRSSQGGLSAAEAVGGFNSYIHGCSISTVSCFFVRGGPVEFSPSVLFRSLLNNSDWKLHVTRANIFAFGLYR